MRNLLTLKISHIALIVKDLQIAKNFYSDVLNLEEMDRPNFFIKGLWYKLGKSQLHLMLYENATEPSVHPLNETVQPHFAIAVTEKDFFSIIQKLKSAGTRFIGDIEINSFGIMQIFFYDPDNNMLELNNELSEPTTVSD